MSGQNTIYEMVTERIVAQLEAGTVPWRQPWTVDGQPRNLISDRLYRGINVFLLANRYDSPYWMTFRQVGQLGGRVRKGEHGTVIVFWKIRKANKTGDDGSVTEETVPMLRYYRVWNLRQTEGVKLPKHATEQPSVQSQSPAEAAKLIVKGYTDGPEIRHGAAGASYSPTDDRISMPSPETFASIDAYFHTLFHEMGHSTGHADRLNRHTATDQFRFGSHAYGREELVAEMTAAFLSGEAGILPSTVDGAASYVANWLHTIREDPRAVVVAAGAAQRGADHILGRVAPGSDADQGSDVT